MNEIKIFCPATIANLSCGFDVLGLCLETAGDEMIIRKSDIKGIRITKLVGADLPLETEKNVAGVAALAMLEAIETEFGFEIEIYKHIKAGSGIAQIKKSHNFLTESNIQNILEYFLFYHGYDPYIWNKSINL